MQIKLLDAEDRFINNDFGHGLDMDVLEGTDESRLNFLLSSVGSKTFLKVFDLWLTNRTTDRWCKSRIPRHF